MAPSLGAFCVALIAIGTASKWGSRGLNGESQALSTHFRPSPSCYLVKPLCYQHLGASSLPARVPLTNLKSSPFYLEKKN